MASKPKTKQVGIITPVSLWEKIKRAAEAHGEPLKTFVPRVLDRGLKGLPKPKK